MTTGTGPISSLATGKRTLYSGFQFTAEDDKR